MYVYKMQESLTSIYTVILPRNNAAVFRREHVIKPVKLVDFHSYYKMSAKI